MGSASFSFLGFSILVILLLNLRAGAVAWRQAVLLLSSLIFLSFFSRNLLGWLPFGAFLAFGYFAVITLQAKRQLIAYPALLVAVVVAFVWLKRYSFLPQSLLSPFPYLTLGLSYVFFRVLHLIIDARNGELPARISLVSYLNYSLNFTTLLSGPIQRFQDFEQMQLAAIPLPLDIVVAGEAFERIVTGFFKVNVLSLLFSTLQTGAISHLASTKTGPNKVWLGAVIAALYPLYLYCNFSGYIDIVIGIGRFLRLELPENFNRPFSADNFINFWSRWHITLSTWLKIYVYNPLIIALMRRFPDQTLEPFLGVFAFFVTFFLVGVWHGQTTTFLFFGVLQGGGVSAVKLYQTLMVKYLGRKRFRSLSSGPVYNALARGLTYTWFAFTLLWFWSNWAQIGSLANLLGRVTLVETWLLILVVATVSLQLWESVRGLLLSFGPPGRPFLTSRYCRTVWNTVLAVIALAVTALMNAPAPDIVYKSF